MQRQKTSIEPTINYDLSPFMPHNLNLNRSATFENESSEELREKLKIKSEALNLMSKQLELCNKEKFEYKRLIDILYDKNLSLKKSLYFKQNQVDAEDENFFQLNSMPLIDSRRNLLDAHNNNTNKKYQSNSISPNSSTAALFNDIDSEDYVKILKDLVKTLQKEKHDLIQKYEDTKIELNDAKSDLKLLREQIVRERVGSVNEGLTTTIRINPDSVNLITPPKLNKMTSSMSYMSSLSSSSSDGSTFKESMIKEIESLKESKILIENDLKLILCQKEELEVERDAFKNRYLKLNDFLISTSCKHIDLNNNKNNEKNDDSSSISEINYEKLDLTQIKLNIDELISQNKYLNESNQHLKNELEACKNQSKKYKSIIQQQSSQPSLIDNQTSNNKLNLTINNLSSEVNLINKLKIKNLLKSTDDLIQNYQKNLLIQNSNQSNQNHSSNSLISSIVERAIELKLVVETLLECLNDKLIANQHQRKVNKMLATRIQDLEKQLNQYNKLTLNKGQNSIDNIIHDTPNLEINSHNIPTENTSPFASLSSNLILSETLIPTKTNICQENCDLNSDHINNSLMKFDENEPY